jgi:hypothetical protein
MKPVTYSVLNALLLAATIAHCQDSPPRADLPAVEPPPLEAQMQACAHAVRKNAASPDATSCVAKLKGQASGLIDKAETALAAGSFDTALDWSRDASTVNPDANPAKFKAIRDRWVLHERDLQKVGALRDKLAKKLVPTNDELADLVKNDFPDILRDAVDITRRSNLAREPVGVQVGMALLGAGGQDGDALLKIRDNCLEIVRIDPTNQQAQTCVKEAIKARVDLNDLKAEATIASATQKIAKGERDAAATALIPLLSDPGLSKAVQDTAKAAMEKTAPSTGPLQIFKEGLKSPWIIQFLTGMMLLVVTWVGLHVARFL